MIGNLVDRVRYSLNLRNLMIAVALCLVAVLFYNSRNVFASQMTGASNYLHNVSQYLKYQYQEMTHEFDAVITKPVSRSWVNIEGVTQAGHIAIRIYEPNGGIKTVAAELADLDIHDVYGAALLVKRFVRQQAEVDYYEYTKNEEVHKCVVVWLDDGRPLNLLLIEQGVATPTINPPTNIVNQLMIAYYKGLIQ